jgi:uncharacterized membrane protein YqaE (UPF0057 family)
VAFSGAAATESQTLEGTSIIVNKLVLILIAVCLPPVAVVLKRGFGKDLLINILLCLLLFFPGMIHALWVVSN